MSNIIEIVVTNDLKYIKYNNSIILTVCNILTNYKYYYRLKNTNYILYIPDFLYGNFYKDNKLINFILYFNIKF